MNIKDTQTVVKKKSAIIRKSGTKTAGLCSWLETAIEFPFFNVFDAKLISFLKVSRPTVPQQKKGTTVAKKISALKEN